jgi:pantothenate kinase
MLSHFLIATVLSHSSLLQCSVIPRATARVGGGSVGGGTRVGGGLRLSPARPTDRAALLPHEVAPAFVILENVQHNLEND